ncbi:hypothetical protein [Mucilaginibacter sp.]|uniref:hypothetical protein n=1 Tax=Mucilaginibacter sp. TaxID=1882438 RepID=UPI0028515F47|nr:hypothetical protein [Mucilaginibacter sp.]MDR3697410.1 hypothetical protein [Mucilaginibacter sp.]
MESAANISSRSLQYYVIDRHWASDLEFFRIETAFLHRLLEDHFIPLCNQAHIAELTHSGMKLYSLEKEENVVNKLLQDQLKYLELIAGDIIPEDVDDLAANQINLEGMVANLMNDFRETKKDIFRLVAGLTHQNKLIAEH